MGATSNFAMYNVDGGQRALIFGRFQNGLIGGARGEGTHLYVPFLQWPIVVDVRTRYAKLQAETGSKDLQNVHLVLRVRPSRRWRVIVLAHSLRCCTSRRSTS